MYGSLRPGTVLPVVVGALHAFHRIDEMHVAVIQRAALRQRRERRQAIECDVDLAGRTANLEVLDAAVEFLRQIVLVHAGQERALYVHRRDDDTSVDLVAVLKCNACYLAVLDDDLVDAGFGTQFAAGRLVGTCDGLRNRTGTAASESPGTDVAVDIAHVVMQQNVGRSGRMNAERGADNAAAGECRLDHIGLEILVQVLGDAHGPETNRLVHAILAHVHELAADAQRVPSNPVGLNDVGSGAVLSRKSRMNRHWRIVSAE